MKAIALFFLLAACATAPRPIVDVPPPAKFANVPRYEPGGPISPPKRTYIAEPVAPRRGAHGMATVETVIDETGRVVESWYVAGDRSLASLLIDQIRRSSFTPAMLNGRPTAVRVQTSMTVR